MELRSPKVRWLRALAIVVTLAAVQAGSEIKTTALTSTTGKVFIYWAGSTVRAQHIDHISATEINEANVDGELDSLPADVNIISDVPGLFTPDGCQLNPQRFTQWQHSANVLAPHLSRIDALFFLDEPDERAAQCYGPQQGNETELQAIVRQQNALKQVLTDAAAFVKSTVTPNTPGANWSQVKVWVNYGSKFRHSGVTMAQNIDWTSFDCYGDFENCWGEGLSIPQLVDILATKLPNAATQKILLMPDASCFMYHERWRKFPESELFVRALEYWTLAKTHPRVHGLVPFIWDWDPHAVTFTPPNNPHAIADSPGLMELYRNIGKNILTNFVPSYSTVSVAPECLTTSPTGACNVNISWTQTSGTNVGVYARQVGNPDGVFGPICPGATSCAMPAGPGDYIVELRELWWDVNSRLIDAKRVKVRYANGTPTGQITFAPPQCHFGVAGCIYTMAANAQNAPSASLFLTGSPHALCTGRLVFCQGSIVLPNGAHTISLELRANTSPSSALLDQRTFTFQVP